MSAIEKKNRARFGDERVDFLKKKNKDFQNMKKGGMTKDEFIKKYPKSITAQRAAGLRDHTEWDAYDLVLEYLHSSGQVATIEEANYVMTEMDAKTIQDIVEMDKAGGIGALTAIGTAGAFLAKPAVDAVSNTVKMLKGIKKKKEDAMTPKS